MDIHSDILGVGMGVGWSSACAGERRRHERQDDDQCLVWRVVGRVDRASIGDHHRVPLMRCRSVRRWGRVGRV
jgi:hypothetical protein